MAIFNWGIYAGIGLAFPVGRYVTEMNVGGLVSKTAFTNRFLLQSHFVFYNLLMSRLHFGRSKVKSNCRSVFLNIVPVLFAPRPADNLTIQSL